MDVIDSQLCGYYRQHIRGVKLLRWSSRQMYQLEAGGRQHGDILHRTWPLVEEHSPWI